MNRILALSGGWVPVIQGKLISRFLSIFYKTCVGLAILIYFGIGIKYAQSLSSWRIILALVLSTVVCIVLYLFSNFIWSLYPRKIEYINKERFYDDVEGIMGLFPLSEPNNLLLEKWYIRKALKEHKELYEFIHKKIIDAGFEYSEDKNLNNFYSEYCAAQAAVGIRKGCNLEELSKRLRGGKHGWSFWHPPSQEEDEYFQDLAKDILMHLENSQDTKKTVT